MAIEIDFSDSRKQILAVLEVCLTSKERKTFPEGFISLGHWRMKRYDYMIELGSNMENLIVHESIHLLIERLVSVDASHRFDKVEYKTRIVWNNGENFLGTENND